MEARPPLRPQKGGPRGVYRPPPMGGVPLDPLLPLYWQGKRGPKGFKKWSKSDFLVTFRPKPPGFGQETPNPSGNSNMKTSRSYQIGGGYPQKEGSTPPFQWSEAVLHGF